MSLDGDLSEELTKNPSENLWPSEKRVRVRLNPAPEFLDFDERDVTLSAFDPADVGSVQLAHICKRFLRHA